MLGEDVPTFVCYRFAPKFSHGKSGFGFFAFGAGGGGRADGRLFFFLKDGSLPFKTALNLSTKDLGVTDGFFPKRGDHVFIFFRQRGLPFR